MKLQFAFLILCITTFTSCSKSITEEDEFIFESTSVVIAISNPIEQEIFTLVNEHRVSIGKNELQFNIDAYNSASAHNDYMISKGKISHDKFNYRASELSKKTNAKAIGENVAKEYTNAVDVFNGWLSSPTHKKAIEGEYTHTAVNVKKNKKGKLYFTQLFFE